MDTKRIKLLGSNLDCLTMQETLIIVEDIIQEGIPTQHVVINANKINLMAKDEKLREIVNSCPLINADGQSIVWAARFLGYSLPGRVTGIDLFEEVVKLANQKGYSVYYFGAEEAIVQKVIQIHRKKYPNLKIVGFKNGYFQKNDSKKIAQKIAACKPDILFVAFSSPKKEEWIHCYKDVIKVPFMMGVGGSFDVISGNKKRAPKFMQKFGLEWFYRFIQEPRRMYARYIVGNTIFLKRVLHEKFNGGINNE